MRIDCTSRPASLAGVALMAFITASLVFPAQSHAFGGGGSYNGPALSGPSIPVETDQIPTFSDYQNTVAYCLQDLGESLWEQAYRTRPDEKFKRRVELSLLPDQCTYHLGITYLPEAGVSSDLPQGYSDAVQHGVVLMDDFCNPHFQLSIALPPVIRQLPHLPGVVPPPPGSVDIETLEFSDSSGLPQVRFDQEVKKTAFDEFGRIVDLNQVLLHDVSIKLPADHGPAVPLINQITRQKTSITVNLERYVDCLRTKLQQ